MNKIKTALVITRLDRGGAPDIVMSLFNLLKSSGHQVKLISGHTAFPSKNTEKFIKNHQNSIIVIPELKRNPSLINDCMAFIKLFFLFRKESFDIVQTHTAKAGFIGRITARLAGTPVVMHMSHGHNFYGYFRPLATGLIVLLERMAAFFTDKIVALTDIEKRDMIRYNICKPSKITVLPSALDLNKFDKVEIDIEKKKAEFNIKINNFVVGMIGRLEPIKGPLDFIVACKYIAQKLPQTTFLVVGDGPLKQSLISCSRKLNISDNVIFTGWREDIPEILSILDVVVLTSLNEAVGRVLLEAGALGKPVVATNVGGVPEIVRDNETGVLVPPNAPQKTADAVVDLLKDEKRRYAMGLAAKEWVRSNFDTDKIKDSVHDLYGGFVNIR